MEKLSRDEVNVKVKQYEEFIDNKLKVQLARTLDERDKLYNKIRDLLEVKNSVGVIKTQNLTSMKTLVNLGSDHFVEATIPDTSTIFLDIGLGFHAEFTLDEALEAIDKQTEHYEEKASTLTEKANQIKAHIKLVYEGINELMNF